jgi:hypothetical protein
MSDKTTANRHEAAVRRIQTVLEGYGAGDENADPLYAKLALLIADIMHFVQQNPNAKTAKPIPGARRFVPAAAFERWETNLERDTRRSKAALHGRNDGRPT